MIRYMRAVFIGWMLVNPVMAETAELLENISTNPSLANHHATLARLKEMRIHHEDASLDIALGDVYALLEDPLLALFYYEAAYQQTLLKPNQTMSRVALFKIARIEMSLAYYEAAIQHYQMLQSMNLSHEDKAITQHHLEKIHAIILGEKLRSAALLIEQNQGKGAYQLLQPHLEEPSYRLQFLIGQSLALQEKPQQALAHFQSALPLSQNSEEKKLAEHHIRKMQQWLQSSADTHTFNAPPLLKNTPDKTSYAYYQTMGTDYFLNAQPKLALVSYQTALEKALTQDQQKAALFGIGKSSLWLENYTIAQRAYHRLLKLPLSNTDQEIAISGQTSALLGMDYPRKAHTLQVSVPHYHYPNSIIVASKTELAAGWAYKAKALWNDKHHQKLLASIPPHHHLQRQKEDIEWLLLQNTSRASASLDYFSVKDSDLFKIDRKTAYVSYRLWGVNSNTTLLGTQNSYFDPMHLVDANLLALKQDFFNIQDSLNMTLTGVLSNVIYQPSLNTKPWNPFLWQAGFNYTHNDYFTWTGYNSRGLVETIQALQNNILMSTTETSLLIHPLARINTRGTLFYTQFSDNNQRPGLSAAINALLSRLFGLFAEARYRGYKNSISNDPNYFSPEQLQELSLFLILKYRLRPTLFLYADGGVGRQWLQPGADAPVSNRPVYTYNIALNQRLNSWAEISANYGYTQDVFNNLVGAYAQSYFRVNFKIYMD